MPGIAWQITRVPLHLLLLLACFPSRSSAEEQNPLAGNYGVEPPMYPTQVYVSTMLDRVLNVDEKLYEFDLVMYVFMSWTDPGALAAIQNATARQNDADYNNGDGCARLCYHADLPFSNAGGTMDCCDLLWLPSLSFHNAVMLPQDRTSVWKGITLSLDKQSVVWRNVIRGIFFTPMDYRRFPFDKQKLQILMSVLHERSDYIQFVPSVLAPEMFTRRVGDALSGWSVDSIRQVITEAVYLTSAVESTLLSGELTADSEFGPLYLYRLNIDTHIVRLSSFFVSNLILPIVFTTLLGFTAFFIDSNDIGTRVGVIVTLVLALITTQFSIGDNLPNSPYMLPTQMLILTSYGFLLFICFESIVVRYITEYPEVARLESAKLAGQERLKRLRDARPLLMTLPSVHVPRDGEGEETEERLDYQSMLYRVGNAVRRRAVRPPGPGTPQDGNVSSGDRNDDDNDNDYDFSQFALPGDGLTHSAPVQRATVKNQSQTSQEPRRFFNLSPFVKRISGLSSGDIEQPVSAPVSDEPSGRRRAHVSKFEDLSSLERETVQRVLAVIENPFPEEQPVRRKKTVHYHSSSQAGTTGGGGARGVSDSGGVPPRLADLAQFGKPSRGSSEAVRHSVGNPGPPPTSEPAGAGASSAAQGSSTDSTGGGNHHVTSHLPPHAMESPPCVPRQRNDGLLYPNGRVDDGDAPLEHVPGDGHYGNAEAEEEAADLEDLMHRLHDLRKSFWWEVLHDQAIASYLGHSIDMWTLAILFPLYVLSTILIFKT